MNIKSYPARAASRWAVVASCAVLCWMWPGRAASQIQPQNGMAGAPLPTTDDVASSSALQQVDASGEDSGIGVPQGDKFRLAVRVLAGYGFDGAQATLGLEKQGRIGYAIVGLFGAIDTHFRYLVEVNPVQDTEPRPACGEQNYFFPNMPQAFGPNVPCEYDGRVRVDDYRFIALDPIHQQGVLRQAYLDYIRPALRVRIGRFILPQGFGWEEAGSFSAKDATHIQRINATADVGVMLSLSSDGAGRRVAEASMAVILGEGNRFHDYDYFYFLDGSFDTNSWPAFLLSGTIGPMRGLEFRGALKRGGDTGSKVERLPNFYASKRTDNAWGLSGRYRPVEHVSIFGELVRYDWGLPTTTAELLGLEPSPVHKGGYYFGAEAFYPILGEMRIGAVVTHEELSRDDSLVQLMASQERYGVRRGATERSTVYRVYADLGGLVRIGGYRNDLSNPYPWLSGSVPVTGPTAFGPGRGTNRWGATITFRVQ